MADRHRHARQQAARQPSGVCRALLSLAAVATFLIAAVATAQTTSGGARDGDSLTAAGDSARARAAGEVGRARALAEALSARAQARAARLRRAQVDSLQDQTERRLQEIAQLPDSLRGPALKQALENLGGALGSLGQELSQLDFQIEDDAISLRDRSGGRVRIVIPPDLGQRISKGIASITASILDELPDTLRLPVPPLPDTTGQRVVRKPGLLIMPHVEWQPERRVVAGNAVKVFGDITVDARDQIAGDAIAVFGSVVVKGRVDGDVVAVLGDVELAPDSEVLHDVTVILGRLERGEDAEIGGNVFTLNPGLPKRAASGRAWAGWLLLGGLLAAYMLLGLLLVLVLALFPEPRLQVAAAALSLRPGACLGAGLLWLLLGNMLVALLMGLLILTLIGIPLALLVGLAALGLSLLGVGLTTSRLAARMRGRPMEAGRRSMGHALLGFLLLCAPGLLGGLLAPVSSLTGLTLALQAISALLLLAAAAVGLGALLRTRLGRSAWPAEAPPPPPRFAA